MKIYYNPILTERARWLRNNSTLSEILLWKHLKTGQMKGYDFHRQKPINNYIVDFFCYQLRLIIEIDGDSHIGKEEYDANRQATLEALGLHFLRFDDQLVKDDIDQVLATIEEWIDAFEKQLPK
ncbi:MAG: DUF559 domain-containing protein [Bacteroidia bacterium]|nr:DUF559 domain-containing protein [Bacteroidia bacterium]